MTTNRFTALKFLSMALAIALSLFSVEIWADDTALRSTMESVHGPDGDAREAALTSLTDTEDPRILGFLEDYKLGRLFLFEEQLFRGDVIKNKDSVSVVPLQDYLDHHPIEDGAGKPRVIIKRELKVLVVPRSDRRALENAILVHTLRDGTVKQRSEAAQRLGTTARPEYIKLLQETAKTDSSPKVVYAAHESIGILQLQDTTSDPEAIMAAARALGELNSLRGKARLQQELEKMHLQLSRGEVVHHDVRKVLHEQHQSIERYHDRASLLKSLFNGISTGSILILISLGLAIVFGQMGVINMAHGELVMLGAYATYVMQLAFGHTPEDTNNWFYVAALPMAFLISALAGVMIEYFVVRHLYKRPLQSLLATWGVGLILIQFVRAGFPWKGYELAIQWLPDFLLWGGFGDNIGVNAPTWLVGAIELGPGLVIPFNRVFIIILTLIIVCAIAWMMKYTRLGLRIRATVQNRDTASSLGVNTRWVDRLTFAIGSGLAGIAGCALTTLAGVTPDMGQNYIVDSFLVVVTGGVGKLAGTVSAGGGIGVLNTWLETTTFGTSLFITGLLAVVVGWMVLGFRARKSGQLTGIRTVLAPLFFMRLRHEPGVIKAGVMLVGGVLVMAVLTVNHTEHFMFVFDEEVAIESGDRLMLVDQEAGYQVFEFRSDGTTDPTTEGHVVIPIDVSQSPFSESTAQTIVDVVNQQDDLAVSAWVDKSFHYAGVAKNPEDAGSVVDHTGSRIKLRGVSELSLTSDLNWLGVAEIGTEGFRAKPTIASRQIPLITRMGALPVRTIWAKVLILIIVMIFIQWRPAGMFPPRGRSADA